MDEVGREFDLNLGVLLWEVFLGAGLMPGRCECLYYRAPS